jgi:hypothetical protein
MSQAVSGKRVAEDPSPRIPDALNSSNSEMAPAVF